MAEETEPRGGLDGEAEHHAAFLDRLREEVIAHAGHLDIAVELARADS